MKLSFKGKAAVVTGACGGIGLECVKKLDKAGSPEYIKNVYGVGYKFINE